MAVNVTLQTANIGIATVTVEHVIRDVAQRAASREGSAPYQQR